MKTITIRYYFTLPEGVREAFELQFDAQKIELSSDLPDVMPPWTTLDFHQCPHCPLKPTDHSHCPLAVNLVTIVERFEGLLSYKKIEVDVIMEERFITRDVSVQRGISSLMGLLMATSSCPHMVFLKPMARFHLPFANAEETVYRATSMYLVAQYFLHKEGHDADLDLTGLRDIYRNIEIVNIAVAKRLRAATETDSAVNAIIMLDIFTKAIPVVIDDSLEEIRYLFTPYFKSMPRGSTKKS
jgi:hypothetical protein